MNKPNYIEIKGNLIKSIEIAIKVFETYPPIGFEKKDIDNIKISYSIFEKKLKSIDEKKINIQSIKYLERDIFTYFQESQNDTVEHFWRLIYKARLPFVRKKLISIIIKREKINDIYEYNYVKDVLVAKIQEKVLNEEKAKLLEKLIDDFEKNN